jgi:hypothetical protein
VILFTHPSTSSPRHFLLLSVAPHQSAAAATARRRQPPLLPPSPDPELLEHHRDPLVLTSPSNFVLLHPNIISRSAGELKAPLPLGLAVDPPIQSFLAPAKHTVSTTSSRGSSSTTSPPPSGTPASRTSCRHRRRWKPEPPHRRQPPSAPSPTKLGTGNAPPHSHDTYARLLYPCSPAPRRDR